MLKIAIIGCGQIGSRHLQGLSKISEPVKLFLIDSCVDSIKTSIDRFEEVVSKQERNKFELQVVDIGSINCNLDFAIISTSSAERANLTSKLLLNTKVKFIIFEKFLFQNRSDYLKINNLLNMVKVNAWVNQWMSSSEAYIEIADWFGSDLQEIIVTGNNWGMGCNSVHYIDYFDKVTGRKSLELIESNIDNKVLKIKREGYYEVTGSIVIRSENGVKLTLKSRKAKKTELAKLIMIGKNKRIEASTNNQILTCNYFDASNGELTKNFDIPFQSSITGSIIENICLNQNSSLPTYDQSVKHHLVLFDSLQSNFNLKNKCLIT